MSTKNNTQDTRKDNISNKPKTNHKKYANKKKVSKKRNKNLKSKRKKMQHSLENSVPVNTAKNMSTQIDSKNDIIKDNNHNTKTTEKKDKKDIKIIANDIHSLNQKDLLDTNDTKKDIKKIDTTEKKENSKEKRFKDINLKLKSKKAIILYVLVAVLIILILSLSVFFAIRTKKNPYILNNISVSGIDVSFLTKNEAKERVESVLNQKLSQEIILSHNDFVTTISSKDFNAHFNIDESINTAYNIGRESNIFKNNFEIISLKFNKRDIDCKLEYDQELLNKLLDEVSKKLPDSVTSPTYYIENSKLYIEPGKDGVQITNDIMTEEILKCLYNTNNSNKSIDIPVKSATADPIDLDAVYKEIYKEPTDAYFSTNPYAVYPSSTGTDFNISLDEAKQMISTPAEIYTIPLKTLYPKVSTNDIGNEAFPDTLATFSTNYSASNYNRSTNLELASSKINGVVIMPGNTFSYNQTVGPRTVAAGFKSAPVYMNGEVTTGIGGGICQVSSTLYNAVLLANLQIDERYNHGFLTGYVKAGTDATVSWGSLDFKFTNTRTYPVKINSYASKGKITVSILGLKSDVEYEVKIVSNVIQTIYPKTEQQYSTSLPKGVTKTISSGSNGCRAESYRVLYLNGKEVSRTLLARDTYNPHNKVVMIGTKE